MHQLAPVSPVVSTASTVRRWQIRHADVLAAAGKLPLQQKAALLWLDDYARTHNLSRKELASRLVKPVGGGTYDEDTLYNIITGRRTSGIDNFVLAIDTLKRSAPAHSIGIDDFPFTHTELTDAIWKYAMLVWRRKRIGLMIGESQSGKSRNLKAFAEAQPYGQVYYIQLPTDAHLSAVVTQMCDDRHVTNKFNLGIRKLALSKTFDSSMLIIVDEIEECASRTRSGGRTTGVRSNTIDFFRWLRDTRGCAVLMAGAPEAMDMLNDANYTAFVRTLRRGIPPYRLKTKPDVSTLNAFADKLGLPPATGVALDAQNVTIKKMGLGYWLMYLLDAVDTAKGQQVTWKHVLDVYVIYKNAETEAKKEAEEKIK